MHARQSTVHRPLVGLLYNLPISTCAPEQRGHSQAVELELNASTHRYFGGLPFYTIIVIHRDTTAQRNGIVGIRQVIFEILFEKIFHFSHSTQYCLHFTRHHTKQAGI